MSSCVGRAGSLPAGHDHGQVELRLVGGVGQRLGVEARVDEDGCPDPEHGRRDRHEQDQGPDESGPDASRPAHPCLASARYRAAL